MDLEPTTLADVIRLIEEVLHEHYRVDAAPLLRQVGIDPRQIELSGSRLSRDSVMQLWELAATATGDPSIGLVIGSRVRATTFYALGVAFMTGETLSKSLELLCRYYRVIVTVPLQLELLHSESSSELRITYTDPRFPLLPIPFDSFIASIIGLCRIATTLAFHPLEVRLAFADNKRSRDYAALFNAPITFAAGVNTLVFDRAVLEQPLPGRSHDLLRVSDRVIENYLEALSPDAVSTEVRRLLLSMLPAGAVSQEAVARRLHMSKSTLHRRLREESTSYQEVTSSTLQSLAKDYVSDSTHSLAYIAFLLGFSDQSNFSRAFRRWTGMSPKAYRDALNVASQVDMPKS
jgi:AraC-like DNA-binding protein